MNYHRINKHDVANGEGIRVSLFVAGCSIHCKGCFNSETWDFDSGQQFTDEKAEELLQACEPDYIAGLSVLGGEPLDNEEGLLPLVKEFKKRFPHKDIWLWTGYDINQLLNKDSENGVLAYVDTLVYGPFIEEEKDLRLKWRGSKNQKVARLVEI